MFFIFIYWAFWACKVKELLSLLTDHTSPWKDFCLLSNTYHRDKFTFYVWCLDCVCVCACVWTQERTGFSEKVSFGSFFQHVVANRFFSWVNGDMETANCCSSSVIVCLCLSSRKSFGQMGLLSTSPLPRLTRLFDLHIVKSSIYFVGDERRVILMFLSTLH